MIEVVKTGAWAVVVFIPYVKLVQIITSLHCLLIVHERCSGAG